MDSTNPLSQSSNFMDLLSSQKDGVYSQPFPYEGFSPSIALGSSDVPLFSTQCTDVPSLGRETFAERRERTKWTPTDDGVLISAWLNTSKDALVGNEQKSGTFWKRIAEYFAASPLVVGSEKRSSSNCKQRWSKINDMVCKFCGSYAAAKRAKSSGQNENDVLKLAHQIFFNDHKKRFTLEHAWIDLRNDQKWCDLSISKNDGSAKRRKCEEGAQSSYSDVGDQPSPRPPGVKAAKAAKGKGKRSVEGGTKLLEFQSMWEIKKEDIAATAEQSKLGILENLLAKKEPLSEIEEALKNKLITDMLSN